MNPYEWMSEAEVQAALAEYITLNYPTALFHSDYGSGVKLTPRQAAMQKRQNGGRSKWPDMFIAEARCTEKYSGDAHRRLLQQAMEEIDFELATDRHFGLFLELKKDGTRLKKKNGDWANEHIAAQAEMLELLRFRGYCAEFAVGFEQAREIVDKYMGKAKETECY